MAHRLIEMLNALGEEAETTINNLNSGGCAVFAAHVGYHLKYRAGISNVRLRIGHSFADECDQIPTIEEARKNTHSNANAHDWNDVGVHFGHVIVEFELDDRVYHYDSSGVTRAAGVTENFGFVLHKGALTIEEGLQIACDPSGWNSSFNRSQIPTTIDIISRHFAGVTF